MTVGSILWRRLDSPGHDACRLQQGGPGWQVDGTAVFQLGGCPARLTYGATCDVSWRAQSGHVRGWIGDRTVALSVERTAAGAWTLNGEEVPGLRDCVDLDFGFTPSTNLLQLRRLALDCGQAADAPAAWLDVSTGVLDVLGQRYERRSETTYWYQAPRFAYAALLEVDHVGFVRTYPGLWQAES
ncbi:MAG TPA: putative glycolipid-binding domain-containing protein [Polyangia bacterium]|nr:putative glycolipid-binding domain-containing protein [Polyangia bacterium]